MPYSNRTDALAVLDALGIDRAIVVGNSQGSQIAVDLAIEHPERVAAVVAVGPGIGGYEPEPTALEAQLYEQMDRLEANGNAEAIAAFDADLWVNGPGQPSDRVPAHIRDLVRQLDFDNLHPPRDSGQPIRLEPTAAGRLDELTAPVLAIAGDLDVSDAWLTAQYLAANAPNARAVLLPGVAHMIGMEAPADLARLIGELVATLPDS